MKITRIHFFFSSFFGYTVSKFSSELKVGFLEYIRIFQVLLRLLCIYPPVNLSA